MLRTSIPAPSALCLLLLLGCQAGPSTEASTLPAPAAGGAISAPGTPSGEASTSDPVGRGQDDSPLAPQIAAADAAIDAVSAVPAGQRTWANTVGAIDDAVARLFNDSWTIRFMSQVSSDSAVRERGRRASADLGDWFTLLNKREDLYRAVSAYAATGPALDPVQQRFMDDTLRDFRRDGMELSQEERDRLLGIDRELNELGIEFQKNIADDESVVYLTEAELEGVPAAVLETLPRSAELYLVSPKGSALGRILGLCQVEATRKKIGVAAGRRAGLQNVELLERMIALRSDKARLLGYEHIADFQTETRMAKDAQAVWDFYSELRPKLRRKAERDYAEYLAAKREHTGDPEAELRPWDLSFYKNWLMRERYAVDSEKVREYFPIDAVTAGLFEVTQELYGLRYEDITQSAEERGFPIWHADVKLFEVSDRESGEVLGAFYTDLHPRPNKYSHAAQFPLELRKRWPDGTLSKPLVALVCNFTKPTPDTPALISHREVQTYFHEFGHCLHSILTETELASYSGTQVARDFVEAPSQMFENWVWNPDVLARFARHYDSGEPLPEDMLRGMLAAKNLGSGLATEGQIFLGVMDMRFHTDLDGKVDTTAVRNEVYADTRMFAATENVYSQAAFGHMVGYFAGYYGYLWSLVYAQDMFSRFEQDGVMNAETGRAYRTLVLSRGGTRDELDLVRDFLGREPNSDAFLVHLGLDTE